MDSDRASAEVEKIFDEWYPYLVRYGRRLCREHAAVEDCIQQVMLLLFRKLRRGGNVPNPKAWVLLVLRRELLRSLRRERIHVVMTKHPVSEPVAEDYESLPVARVDSFLALLSTREAEVLLRRRSGCHRRGFWRHHSPHSASPERTDQPGPAQ